MKNRIDFSLEFRLTADMRPICRRWSSYFRSKKKDWHSHRKHSGEQNGDKGLSDRHHSIAPGVDGCLKVLIILL